LRHFFGFGRCTRAFAGDLDGGIGLAELQACTSCEVREETPSMTIRARVAGSLAVVLTLVSAGCGSNPRPQVSAKAAPPPPSPTASAQQPAPRPQPASDPVAVLIQVSQKHFEAGERELKMGHMERARAEFDRAVDVLLESPYGARTDARLREYFDRLIDRINAREVTALAQGDGFSTEKTEPAAIDEILRIATFPQPETPATTEEAVKADLATTVHDIPIPQNERVLSAVELLRTRLRGYVQESLVRGAKYLPMIQNVFRAEGLPLDLAYIPIIESGFKTNALSRASAKGPWQFMRSTAVENGLRHDWYIDERSDPEKSTIAAAKYLKSLHDLFGDWNLVLAAYNGGLGRVQRAIRRSGREDFWALSATSKYLPRETREYVPLILASIVVAKNPLQYGLEITPGEPLQYEKVTVPRAIDLRRVAEWTESSIDQIQALNPELRRLTTPVRVRDYEVRVPVGTAEVFEKRLAEATPADFATLKWYVVKRGDTIATVARRNRVKRADLAAANGLGTRSRLAAGQSLVIPGAPATLLATRTPRTAPAAVTAADTPAASDPSEPATQSVSRAADVVTAPGKKIVYRVKRGDTLSSIARVFGTSVARIKSLNRLRGSTITAGTRLSIVKGRR
jgi:membrane-bound lytic murein transglycosylase D